MISLREQGEYYRLALAMGLIDPSAITAWADNVILSLDCPPDEIIEISLAGRKSVYEMLDLLAALPGTANGDNTSHRVLGLLREKLQRKEIILSGAMKALDTYRLWRPLPESEYLALAMLDDAYSLAIQGIWGTPENVRAELEEFLYEYSIDSDLDSPL